MYINYPCILGRFREYGADVELICEFPRGTNIVSNIVWERVPSSSGDRLVNSAIREIYTARTDNCSKLRIFSEEIYKSKICFKICRYCREK